MTRGAVEYDSKMIPSPGRDPGVHVLASGTRREEDVDGRVKPGHGVESVDKPYAMGGRSAASDSWKVPIRLIPSKAAVL